MKKILALVAIIWLVFEPPKIFASWISGGGGARASGLFGSYSAGGNDIFGICYNPANLGFVRYWEIGLDYNRQFIGLSDDSLLATGFLGVNIPLRRLKEIRQEKIVSQDQGPINISTNSVVTSTASTVSAGFPLEFKQKIRLYEHIGSIGLGWENFRLNDEYQRSIYYLTYSWPVGEKIVLGLSGKFLQQKYTIDEYLVDSPVFEYGRKDSAQAFSGDIGLIYNPWPQIFIGLSGQDLSSPDLGLQSPDRVLPTYRFGLGWRSSDGFWALEYSNENEKSYYSTGLEKHWGKVFVGRLGMGFGEKDYAGISGGFTFDFYSAAFTYGFVFPLTGMKNIYGDHRLSFVYKFGRWHLADIEKGTLEYSYRKLQDELQDYKLRLAESENEKERLQVLLVEEATLRIKERMKMVQEQKPPAEKAPASETEPAHRVRTHTVEPGDTLQTLAIRYFGDARYWVDIYQVNKEKVGPGGSLSPRQVLIIPIVESSATVSPAPVAEELTTPEVIKATEPVVITTGPITPAVVPVVIEKERKKEVKEKYTFPLKHVVVAGDNLRSLAMKYYNNPERWKDIYEVNRNKLIRGNLIPGTEIIIPK